MERASSVAQGLLIKRPGGCRHLLQTNQFMGFGAFGRTRFIAIEAVERLIGHATGEEKQREEVAVTAECRDASQRYLRFNSVEPTVHA